MTTARVSQNATPLKLLMAYKTPGTLPQFEEGKPFTFFQLPDDMSLIYMVNG